ncbi:MAG: ATP-binding protein [Bacteroidales bacterium]
MDFVNRSVELDLLQSALQRENRQLVIVMGRRRIGKSRLIREVLRSDDVYMLADQSDATIQRSYLASAAAPIIPGFNEVVYPTWDSLLSQLNRRCKKGTLICLDEFPYLVKSAPELPSIIQRLTDNREELNFHLILCGSSQQMMSKLVFDQTAPLYGRADEILRLRPMNIFTLREFLSVDAVAAIEEYSVWGGIPRYWEIREQYKSLDEAINFAILNPLGVLHEEPTRLFLDDLRTTIQADSLLSVIGNGCHRLSEIAARLQKPATHLNHPLNTLIELGFVRRDIPYGESIQSTKRTLYRVSDPFLRFYFRYVSPNRSLLVLDDSAAVNQQIRSGFAQFTASQWEQICRESIHRIHPDIAWLPAQSWWGNDRNSKPLELDLVSETADRKTMLIGECKWADKVNPEAILTELKEKTSRLHWLDGRNIQYVLFTKHQQSGPEQLKIITAGEVTSS